MIENSLQNWTFDGFQAIVFQLHGIRFAADLEQIDELLSQDTFDNENEEVVPLHQLISLDQVPPTYRDPRIITIHSNGLSLAIKIDQPEDVIFLQKEAICPFPLPVSLLKSVDSIWGVGLINNEPVMLIDCQKLIASHLKPDLATSVVTRAEPELYSLSAKHSGDPTG